MTHESNPMRCGLGAAVLILLCATAAAAAAPAQRTFGSPDDAAKALVDAVRTKDEKAMLAILGADAKPVISSGDPVADEAASERFVHSYDEAHDFVPGPDDETILQTGKDRWPLPIPLVNTAAGWRFDTAAGGEELVDRRIGKNELDTIQTCLAYVDAQREYFARNPLGGKLHGYAQKISSSPGKKDGLYWDTAAGEAPSPLGELFAQARTQGYAPGGAKPAPYHGYLYRILTAQGPHAPGGKYDYVVRGMMIGGFAAIAYPAQWGVSGVMTFIVSHDGGVYERNLGPNTAKLAQGIKAFDPDEAWVKVADAAAPVTASASASEPASEAPAKH